ncbi:DJ-1/PfpI family protein [Streptomyces zagrosensis]|uniref:Transcriptional regulator GlxA family with amidase domain n=1 Tax=Streptomyces zagrosensis TaxID=1042984 RepID=A0A7W9Q6H5_9ACTN|nr:DJ-1/PfpI family protein [Streptomyces zagrosensis]MBB5934018.1 transcriptional regulator GlxA family with amidase domain [Streptomyces zagrosensis]
MSLDGNTSATSGGAPPRTIGILLFPGVEELDAIGPWEVLSYWTQHFPDDGWRVFCFSADGNPVTCAKGLTVQAHRSAAELPALDVLIHPGGRGTRPMLTDEAHLAWVRRERERVPLMASVCTGALVYAAAGLLSGRPATTHWASLDELRELDPTIDVRAGERFVDDGDVLTSAGISAGIDMSFHLVARLTSPERAERVRKGIEYAPEPLVPAGVVGLSPPREGLVAG